MSYFTTVCSSSAFVVILNWSRRLRRRQLLGEIIPEVSEYSSDCRDGSDWLSIRRLVTSKLGTRSPYLPLPLSLHSSYADSERSALDTLDCISINVETLGPAHFCTFPR